MSSGIYATHPSGRPDGLRDILRHQDKIRSQHDLGLKRRPQKLRQRETYNAAPHGYVFMPLGTPELADYCKKLSTQQGWPIHVVNAKPTSKVVLDVTKVSHHTQRIGYHFKDSVVEEACSYLHYVISGGKFISEEELKQSSFVAKVMAKHGLSAVTKQESPEHVKAAIRELFPYIPDSDLTEVVKHAWDEKSGRVGTIQDMELSRRIQLAVLARIRHKYTDYDVLLKSFDWHSCRREVEPVCLKKLLEWRGEAGDDSLEEIVAETMLLDEQSDANRPRPQRKSNRRTSGYDTGDASDASVELSHRVAADHDLRPESPGERAYGYFNGRVAAVQSYAYRHEVARAKIQAVRAQMALQPPIQAGPSGQIERIHVQTDNTGKAPAQIIVGGKVLRRASPEPQQQPSYPQTQQPVYAQHPPQLNQAIQLQPLPPQHHQAVHYQPQPPQYAQPAQYSSQTPPQYSQPPQYAQPAQYTPQPLQPYQQPVQYLPQPQQQYVLPTYIVSTQYAPQQPPGQPQYAPSQYQPIHGAPARVQQAASSQSIPQPQQQWPPQLFQAPPQQAPHGQYPHR